MSTQRRRTPQQWQALVERQRESGLSIAEFARREDLKYQTFFRWCSRTDSSATQIVPEPVPDFIEIGMADESLARSNEWLVELDLGGGVHLRIRQPG